MARRNTARKGDTGATKTLQRHGRPTALTPRVEEAILGNLIGGMSIDASCALAGIGVRTFYSWMNRGEQAREMLDEHGTIPESEAPFLHFQQSALDARAQAEARAVKVVMTAMHGGYLTSEEPMVDLNGEVLRDDNGNILYKRTYTPPDGRLALSYLQRARPRDWSTRSDVNVNAQVSGPGGGPIEVAVEQRQVEDLASRLVTVRQQFEDEESEVVDAEVVEDGDE